jgi:hypothetical protein
VAVKGLMLLNSFKCLNICCQPMYATGVVPGKVIKYVVAVRKQDTVLRNIRYVCRTLASMNWFLTRTYILDYWLLIVVSQALHWGTGHKNDCLQIISSSAASNSVLPTVGKGDYVWITKAIYTLNI